MINDNFKRSGKKDDSDKSKRRDVFGLIIPTELTQPKPTSNTDQGNNSSSTPTSSTAPLTSTSSPARTPSISISSTVHTPSTLSNIKVRIPTIRLSKSVANLPTLLTRTYEAPSNRPDGNLSILNFIDEYSIFWKKRLEMANKELLDLQALNQSIIAINEEFEQENDELYKKVGQYETLRKPQSMQKHHTHKKHHCRSDSENSEDETPPRKKVIFRVDSDSISSEDDDGAKKNEISARGEMKSILKTLPDTLNLDYYEETFMSPSNVNTRKKLIPELIKALKLNFQPTYELRLLAETRRFRRDGNLVFPDEKHDRTLEMSVAGRKT
ncbi:unnamed protein product [Rhizophagus irregularis]|nr:unnamed protein product [Rhizophagus irregularis]